MQLGPNIALSAHARASVGRSLDVAIAGMSADFFAWFSLRDLTSVYLGHQGRGGNVSASGETVGLLVGKEGIAGLTLDAFIAAQPVVNSNPTLDDATGWTLSGTTISEGKLNFPGPAAYADITPWSTFSTGVTYSYDLDIEYVSGVSLTTYLRGTVVAPSGDANAHERLFAVAGSNVFYGARVQCSAPWTGSVDNVKFRALPSKLWQQATGSNRPEYDEAGGIRSLVFDGLNDAIGMIGAGPADCSIFCTVNTSDTAGIIFASTTGGIAPAFAGCFYSPGAGSTPSTGAGPATHHVDDGPNISERQAFATALADGEWHTLEIRNANLSAWAGFHIAGYTSGTFTFAGSIGPDLIIIPTADLTDERRADILALMRRGVGL